MTTHLLVVRERNLLQDGDREQYVDEHARDRRNHGHDRAAPCDDDEVTEAERSHRREGVPVPV